MKTLAELVEEYGEEGVKFAIERDRTYHTMEPLGTRIVEGFVSGMKRSFLGTSRKDYDSLRYLDSVFSGTATGSVAYRSGMLAARLLPGIALLYAAQRML